MSKDNAASSRGRRQDPRAGNATPGSPLRPDQLRDEPYVAPTWGQLSTLILAGTALSRLLVADDLPSRAELGPVVDEHIAATRARLKKAKFVRGDVMRAHGTTTRYLHKWLPAELSFAGPDVAQAAKDLADCGNPVADRYRQNRPPGRRLAWAADLNDLGVGLMLDRLHYTHRSDCVSDAWMLEQAHADIALGFELAGEMFAGVRLLAPLTPRSSVHLSADGHRHEIGECRWCASVSPWAQTSAQSLPSTESHGASGTDHGEQEDEVA